MVITMYKHIFVLEDDKTQADTLRSYLSTYSPKVKPIITSSVDEALATLRTHSAFAVYLLDISLGDEANKDGLKVAYTICKMYPQAHLIFITAHPQHVFSAINEHHCMAYLLKPYTREMLFQQLDRIFTDTKYLSLRALDGIYWKIPFSDIYYIESYSRYMHFHTVHGVIESRQFRLKDLESVLSSDFMRCHKSYVVNKTYIQAIDSTTHLLTLHTVDDQIPCSRDFANKLV